MSTQNQQNWNHHFIHFLAQVIHFTRLQTCKKHLSSYILFTLKNTRNSAFHIFIKYYTSLRIQKNLVHQNWTLLDLNMNFQNKHPNLWKQFRKSTNTQTNRWGLLVSGTQTSATREQRRYFDQRYLAGGKISSDDENTYVLGSSSRIDGCARQARRLTRSSSSAAMADGGGRVAVRRRPLTTICSSEVLYSYVVTYQS